MLGKIITTIAFKINPKTPTILIKLHIKYVQKAIIAVKIKYIEC